MGKRKIDTKRTRCIKQGQGLWSNKVEANIAECNSNGLPYLRLAVALTRLHLLEFIWGNESTMDHAGALSIQWLSVLIKWREDTEEEKHRGTSSADRKWLRSYTATSQEPRGASGNGRGKEGAPLEHSEEVWPHQHLGFGLLASSTMKE